MTLQTTLSRAVSCSGIGLHSGSTVSLRLVPAKENAGIVFRRTDIHGKAGLIPARYDLVTDTRLGTTLKNAQGTTVSTIEHLMAALWGMGVDNVVIELNGPEAPIMDGSSEPFIRLIEQAGVSKLSAHRKVIRVLREVEVVEGAGLARVSPLEGEDFTATLEVEIDFEHGAIGRSRAFYDFSAETFEHALSAARTFCLAREVEQMRAHGLARGGSLENAVVVGDDGVMNEEGLRFSDEFVRHKALDCVGDLFLAGYRIEGAFSFYRPGHGVNNALLRALLVDVSAWKLVSTAPAPVKSEPAILHAAAR